MGEVIRFPLNSRPNEAKYPKPDRSDFKPNSGYSDHLDIAWGEGTLSDGRPYRVETWHTEGMTFLEYYFSSLGLEGATKKDLEELLVSAGILVFNSKEDHYVEPKDLTDPSGNKMCNINVMVGDEDGTYVNEAVTYERSNMKRFKRPSSSSVWGPVGQMVEVDPESAEMYVALCDKGLYYWAYFINNSSKPIDVLFENWLVAVNTTGEDVRIDDVDEDFVINNPSLIKHTNIPPKSYIKLNHPYFDWDFDWENWIHLALKTTSEKKLLHFYIPKLLLIKKYERLPVLNREGWVCELQTQEPL